MKKFGVAFHLKYWYSCRPFYQKFFLITLEAYIVHAFPISFCQEITRDLHVHVHLDYMLFENHEEKREKGGGHKPKIIFTTEW